MSLRRAWLCALVLLSACQRDKSGDAHPTREEFEQMKAKYERLKKEEAARARRPKPRKPKLAAAPAAGPSDSAPEDTAPAAAQQGVSAGSQNQAATPWTVDEPVDIAPAGPITATPDGVVLYNRDNAVFLARLGRLPKGTASRRTPVSRLSGAFGRFPLGRGPGVIGRQVYWITDGRLVRTKLDARGRSAPLEVLRSDAQDGTRVAVPLPRETRAGPKLPDTAAYIVKPTKQDGPLRARLWVEGGQTRDLTPEGSSTHAVTLVPTADGLMAVSIQARMAMTPVHTRRIRFEKDKPVLGEDIVVWVGGGVNSLTELTLLPHGKEDLFGFIPHERSITEFGVARLDISMTPSMKTPTSWTLYPNGLDPAPVDAGHICGEPVVLYAQPASADPDASQELVLRSVADPSRFQTLATAEAFFSVSLAAVPGGALVAFVADWVSWAVTARCTARKN